MLDFNQWKFENMIPVVNGATQTILPYAAVTFAPGDGGSADGLRLPHTGTTVQLATQRNNPNRVFFNGPVTIAPNGTGMVQTGPVFVGRTRRVYLNNSQAATGSAVSAGGVIGMSVFGSAGAAIQGELAYTISDGLTSDPIGFGPFLLISGGPILYDGAGGIPTGNLHHQAVFVVRNHTCHWFSDGSHLGPLASMPIAGGDPIRTGSITVPWDGQYLINAYASVWSQSIIPAELHLTVTKNGFITQVAIGCRWHAGGVYAFADMENIAVSEIADLTAGDILWLTNTGTEDTFYECTGFNIQCISINTVNP